MPLSTLDNYLDIYSKYIAIAKLGWGTCLIDENLSDRLKIYDSYDIFISDLEGNILKQVTSEIGYDAEATVSPLGDKIVFTSIKFRIISINLLNLNHDCKHRNLKIYSLSISQIFNY